MLSIERPKDALHEFLVRKGYWWLTQLSSAAYLFGEMFYIHYTIPSFHELMNHFRPHAITDYTLGWCFFHHTNINTNTTTHTIIIININNNTNTNTNSHTDTNTTNTNTDTDTYTNRLYKKDTL